MTSYNFIHTPVFLYSCPLPAKNKDRKFLEESYQRFYFDIIFNGLSFNIFLMEADKKREWVSAIFFHGGVDNKMETEQTVPHQLKLVLL